MDEIKLTHGPNECCECVPHLESDLTAANKRIERMEEGLKHFDNEWGGMKFKVDGKPQELRGFPGLKDALAACKSD